jgi:hypothetical protein
MAYKKKLIVLLSIIAALTLIYTAGLVFDPERTAARSSSYVWMDSSLVTRVNRIVLSSEGESRELVKRNDEWFVLHNGREYPARQARIDDFLALFTQRAPNPVRYSNAASHASLGLDAETASRVTVYGDNSTLFDILIGNEENTGKDVYIRRAGQNEVRSGEYLITVYVKGAAGSWYDLKLFPESEYGEITVDNVQRLLVYGEGEPLIISRSNWRWAVSGVDTAVDQSVIDTYIRMILITEGDDFSEVSADDLQLNHSRVILELENGSVRTIRLSEADETGRRLAHVSGSPYVYSLPSWSAQRLFRNVSDF